VKVQDTTAPAATCPANMFVEATSASGATATFNATATDAITAAPTLGYAPASGGTFALGTTTINATATDAAGNIGRCAFTVTVRDTTAPAITSCPADQVVEATSPSGASVSYAAAIASDAVSAAPAVVYSKGSGSTFALGMTQVQVSATDAAGNAGTCSFTVTVRDTTPPAITCPMSATAEAMSPLGAHVSYAAATASDAVTSAPALAYSQTSASEFPLGMTTVIATATDAAGNTSMCSFAVAVVDTTAPALACPADVSVEASSAQGARVGYAAAIVTEAATVAPMITYSQASGTVFPLGSTTVTVGAVDGSGNSGSCTFKVTVADTTAAAITCPAPFTVEASSAAGAAVDFTVAASDVVSTTPTLTYSMAPKSTFPIGATAVSATAIDAAGNSSTCKTTITVVDSTPPEVVCPADLSAVATNKAGAAVSFAPTVKDAVDPAPEVSFSNDPGSVFALGATNVVVTAKDAAGNAASCQFAVTVQAGGVTKAGCAAAGDSAWWVLAALALLLRARRSSKPTVRR
jgi:hypothetical protein